MKSTFLVFLFIISFGLATEGQNAQSAETVVTSERMEMQGTEDKNYFTFENDVKVRGTNLSINCEKLTVVSARSGGANETVGEIGAIETILAEGNVVIEQAGRIAFAGKAEVDPAKGIVILSDQPRIKDDDVEVEGYQFVLYRGEKKFESIPDPNAAPGESRSKVRLGALPDLGFDKPSEEITNKPDSINVNRPTPESAENPSE